MQRERACCTFQRCCNHKLSLKKTFSYYLTCGHMTCTHTHTGGATMWPTYSLVIHKGLSYTNILTSQDICSSTEISGYGYFPLYIGHTQNGFTFVILNVCQPYTSVCTVYTIQHVMRCDARDATREILSALRCGWGAISFVALHFSCSVFFVLPLCCFCAQSCFVGPPHQPP